MGKYAVYVAGVADAFPIQSDVVPQFSQREGAVQFKHLDGSEITVRASAIVAFQQLPADATVTSMRFSKG